MDPESRGRREKMKGETLNYPTAGEKGGMVHRRGACLQRWRGAGRRSGTHMTAKRSIERLFSMEKGNGGASGNNKTRSRVFSRAPSSLGWVASSVPGPEQKSRQAETEEKSRLLEGTSDSNRAILNPCIANEVILKKGPAEPIRCEGR